VFSFFDMSAINALSRQLIDDFVRLYPDPNAAGAQRQAGQAIAAVERIVMEYVQAKPRLGIFRKAKCANTVKWALQERGYPQVTIDEVVKRVLYGLSNKIKAPTAAPPAPVAAAAPKPAQSHGLGKRRKSRR